MALSKTVPTEFGENVNATYWRLGEVHDVIVDDQLRIVMYGYATETDRRNGKRPLASATIQLNRQQYIKDAGRKELYDAVKASPEFQNAVDV